MIEDVGAEQHIIEADVEVSFTIVMAYEKDGKQEKHVVRGGPLLNLMAAGIRKEEDHDEDSSPITAVAVNPSPDLEAQALSALIAQSLETDTEPLADALHRLMLTPAYTTHLAVALHKAHVMCAEERLLARAAAQHQEEEDGEE